MNGAALLEPHTLSERKERFPYKWRLVVLLWFAFFFNQADRQIYNVVLPLIKSDLKLSDIQLGMVASIFTCVFAVLVPFAGYAGDMLRRKWIIFYSLLFWSSATLFTGISTTLTHLVLFRSLTTGGGEAFYYPSATSLIGQLHTRTRSLAISIHQTAVYAGLIASGFLAGYLGEQYGWRTAFFSFGICGAGLSFFIFLCLRDTPPSQELTTSQRPSAGLVVREVLHRKTAVVLFLAYAGRIFAHVGYLTWMPTLLHEKFGVSLAAAGFSSMFYFCCCAIAGSLAGGRLADRLTQLRATGRLEMQFVGLLFAAPFLCVMALANSFAVSLLGLAGFGFFCGVYDSNQIAGLFDVIPLRVRSSAVGIMVAFGFGVASLAPVLLGCIKQTHGLDIGISTMSLANVAAAACILAAIKHFFARDFISNKAEETQGDTND